MAADRTPNELADALERSQSSYIAEMADGHRSIIVRSKGDELAECYRLMAAAAVLLRRQAEQLDTLRKGISERVRELRAVHRPQWSGPRGYTTEPRDGYLPVGCAECYPHDGSWPCITAEVADALAAAVPQDPERCACGKPATGTVGGVPTCGDDR